MNGRMERAAARTATAGVPGAFALLALLALAPALSGCGGMRVVTRQKALGVLPVPRLMSLSDRIAEAREHARLDPRKPYWPYQLATLELEADSVALAENALGAALSRDAHYAPALALLSKLDFDAGRHAQAVERLEAARVGAPLAPELLAGLALHYDALGRPDLAAQALAEIPPARRQSVGAALVCVTLRGPAPDSAAALAHDLARGRPGCAACQNNEGIVELRAGNPKAARVAFLHAIELDPRLPGPYYNLAILEKFYRFDDEAAAGWFQKYRQRSSDDPDGLAHSFDAPPQELTNKKD